MTLMVNLQRRTSEKSGPSLNPTVNFITSCESFNELPWVKRLIPRRYTAWTLVSFLPSILRLVLNFQNKYWNLHHSTNWSHILLIILLSFNFQRPPFTWKPLNADTSPVELSQEWFCFLGDTWKCLETFLSDLGGGLLVNRRPETRLHIL